MQGFFEAMASYLTSCFGDDPTLERVVEQSLVTPTGLESEVATFCKFFTYTNVIIIGIFCIYFLIHLLLFLIGQNKQPFNPVRIIGSLVLILLTIDAAFLVLFYFFQNGR